MNYVQSALSALYRHPNMRDVEPELLRSYALLLLILGGNTEPRDVHDAWAVWRNSINPDHTSLVPYDDLSEDVQALDLPYLAAIREAAELEG